MYIFFLFIPFTSPDVLPCLNKVTSYKLPIFEKPFSNPDKSDEHDPDLMLSAPRSDYFSVPELNKTIGELGSQTLTIFHCNIRSLSKNLNLLEDVLCTLDSKPDVIGVTETKLNEFSVANVDILSRIIFSILILRQMLVGLPCTSIII